MSNINDLPDGYKDMLKKFTIAVMRSKPKNVQKFAANYFTKLAGTTTADDSDSDMDTDQFSEPIANAADRRKSVAAERYDPEMDDEEDISQKIYPKSDEKKSLLKKVCQGVLIFSCLEEDQLDDVIDAMFEKIVEPKETLITQGDDGDNFYVILSGVYDVFINGNQVIEYNEQGSFGELALMYNTPRAATVISKTKGELYAMDRKTFRRIVLKSQFEKRKIFEDLIESVPLLKTLSANERLTISDALRMRTFQDGEQIIKQGEPGQEMFFIESGEVRVLIRDKPRDPEMEISRLGKCSYFGELALITRKPRAASVFAVGKVHVAVLEVNSFERLLGPCLDVMKRNIEHYNTQIEEIFHTENAGKV